MRIHEFNPEKGIYRFEVDEIETGFHAHPAVELIFSESGRLELETPTSGYKNLSFAVVASNRPHKIRSAVGYVSILMLECNPSYLQRWMSSFGIALCEGIYVEADQGNRAQMIEALANEFHQSDIPFTAHEKIQNCLHHLNSASAEYGGMLKDLKSIANLSDSRLSHLFKQEVGISIKKYLVWSKLKRAFEGVVQGNKNMYEASLAADFYDQAHLSKAFKQMLGISPSDVYNSRMLQG